MRVGSQVRQEVPSYKRDFFSLVFGGRNVAQAPLRKFSPIRKGSFFFFREEGIALPKWAASSDNRMRRSRVLFGKDKKEVPLRFG